MRTRGKDVVGCSCCAADVVDDEEKNDETMLKSHAKTGFGVLSEERTRRPG